jgi:hypothetical protein
VPASSLRYVLRLGPQSAPTILGPSHVAVGEPALPSSQICSFLGNKAKKCTTRIILQRRLPDAAHLERIRVRADRLQEKSPRPFVRSIFSETVSPRNLSSRAECHVLGPIVLFPPLYMNHCNRMIGSFLVQRMTIRRRAALFLNN